MNLLWQQLLIRKSHNVHLLTLKIQWPTTLTTTKPRGQAVLERSCNVMGSIGP
jgi:hypothetical protein